MCNTTLQRAKIPLTFFRGYIRTWARDHKLMPLRNADTRWKNEVSQDNPDFQIPLESQQLRHHRAPFLHSSLWLPRKGHVGFPIRSLYVWYPASSTCRNHLSDILQHVNLLPLGLDIQNFNTYFNTCLLDAYYVPDGLAFWEQPNKPPSNLENLNWVEKPKSRQTKEQPVDQHFSTVEGKRWSFKVAGTVRTDSSPRELPRCTSMLSCPRWSHNVRRHL